MTIRPGTPADAELLSSFGARAFRAAFAGDNSPADMDRYVESAFSRERLAAELAEPGSRFLLLVAQGAEPEQLVGYARLRFGAAQEAVEAERPVELTRIYVDPDVTGAGHGSVLLERCLAEAQAGGADVLWLGVWERNAGALRFYARHGFRQVGAQRFVLGAQVQTDHVLVRPLGT